MIIVGAYIQPSTAAAAMEYCHFFIENLQRSQPEDFIILAGDFNTGTSEFETWASTLNLHRCLAQSPDLFTRSDARSFSTIDDIALNRKPGQWKTIDTEGLSDHQLLVTKISGPFPFNPKRATKYEHRLLADLPEHQLLRILSSHLWPRKSFIEVAQILNLTSLVKLRQDDLTIIRKVE